MRAKSSLVTNASGSVSGLTACSGGRALCFRGLGARRRTATANQRSCRTAWAYLLATWRALSHVQRLTWQAPGPDLPTARQHFFTYNMPAVQHRSPTLVVRAVASGHTWEAIVTGLTLTATRLVGGGVTIAMTAMMTPPIWPSNLNNRLYIWASKPLRTPQSSPRAQLIYVAHTTIVSAPGGYTTKSYTLPAWYADTALTGLRLRLVATQRYGEYYDIGTHRLTIT